MGYEIRMQQLLTPPGKIRACALPLALWVAFAFPVMASTYEDCERAVANGDQKAAAKAATYLLRFRPFPLDKVKISEACISLGKGAPWVFDPGTQEFMPEEAYEKLAAVRQGALRKAVEDEARRARQREETRRMQAALEAQTQKRLSAERAEAAREAEQQAMAKADRDRAVRQRLLDACTRLYAADPDETMTRPLCFQAFMANGLPQ